MVLGASSGFGAASARALAAEGLHVLGAHLDLRGTLPRAEAVRAELEAAGVRAILHNGNAADPVQRDAALDALQAADADAEVAVVLHSLAFGTLRPLVGPEAQRARLRDLAMTLDVMAHSLVTWVQGLDDRGLLRRGARILALTSAGGRVALPAYGPVGAAKAALEAHVRQLAVELAPRGIAVNAILAGLCHTPALERIPGWEALAAGARDRNPSGRLTTPEDVAQAVVALTAPGLAWMTGACVPVDGGESVAVAGGGAA
ncbi:MAG: SDR family oxidoreductase [Alphaproteobacteria bacterium]|nr:SDR family oxidoreductase [Alphaproteobacteria bacterium]